MDAEGGLHQPLAEGKGVVVRQGLDAQRPEANLRFEEHKACIVLQKSFFHQARARKGEGVS